MAKQCTGWQKDGKRIYSKTCKTGRKRKSCRIAPARYSGVPGEDMWTVSCSESAWNAQRGEWRGVARGKMDTTETIFAAKKAADKFLKR